MTGKSTDKYERQAPVKIFKYTLLTLTAFLCLACNAENKNIIDASSWKEDFSTTYKKSDKLLPKEWVLKTKWGVPVTNFYLKKDSSGNNVLCVKSDKSTGTFLRSLSGIVDLNKTPIMRWKWKVVKLPENADGRDEKKDDQAVGIYIGTGKWKQDSIAYRWETETPTGSEGNSSYGGGVVKVKWHCIKNKETPDGQWFIEEKNVAEDFKKAYGYLPDEIAISVVGNSQYTGTTAEAEIQWIEFDSKKTSGLTTGAGAETDNKNIAMKGRQ